MPSGLSGNWLAARFSTGLPHMESCWLLKALDLSACECTLPCAEVQQESHEGLILVKNLNANSQRPLGQTLSQKLTRRLRHCQPEVGHPLSCQPILDCFLRGNASLDGIGLSPHDFDLWSQVCLPARSKPSHSFSAPPPALLGSSLLILLSCFLVAQASCLGLFSDGCFLHVCSLWVIQH